MSLAVVDLKNLELNDKKKDINTENELDGEDLLWKEFIKLLDKIEKGIDGDLSSLSRSARSINKFRKRFTDIIWARLIYTLIPNEYKVEFENNVGLFCNNWGITQVKLISKLCGIEHSDAATKLNDNNGDVFNTILLIVKDKENLAKQEIIKKKIQLLKDKNDKLKKERKLNNALNNNNDNDVEMKDRNNGEIIGETGDDDGILNDDEIKKKVSEEKIDVSLTMIGNKKRKRSFYFETYIFIKLLICYELYDKNDYINSLKIVNELITKTINENRRTCDLLSSKLYYLYSLLNQRLNKLNNIRNKLYEYYQISCLQQNLESQSVLINLILQNYIEFKLYNLGNKFIEKSEFPTTSSSSQFARYNYYCGIISTVKLDYNNALLYMQNGLRRAPQYGAYGFKIKCTKWLIVIQLLMGDIPDKTIFVSIDGKNNKLQLKPYEMITECVREGKLNLFNDTINKYQNIYLNDGLIKILLRLKHNVIKTGLRKINKSYSKISLNEIKNKLNLDSENDAYYIVSKAIKDNIINAKINYKYKYIESKNIINQYSTDKPYKQFATRIKFCLDIYTQAIKSLKYPNTNDDDNDKQKNDEINNEEVAEIILNAMDEDEE